jgi:hypothetical protein
VKFFSGGIIAAMILGIWMVIGGLKGFESAAKINERLIQRSEAAAQQEMVTWPVKTYSSQAVIPVYRYFAMLVGNDLTRAGIKIRYIMIMVFISVAAIVYLLYKKRKELPDFIWLSILVLSSSILVSTVTALKSGHMTSFEYTHYMMPFSILIIGYLLGEIRRSAPLNTRIAGGVVLFSSICMLPGLVAEMNDRLSPESRLVNPFETNLYLKTNDAKQMIDASAANKILVRKKSGEEKEIINLKDQYN